MGIKIKIGNTAISIGFYFFLSLIEVVSMYKSFIVDVSLSSAILVFLSLISIVIILRYHKKIDYRFIFCLFLYYSWVIIKSNSFYRVISVIALLNLVAISIKPDNDLTFRKMLEYIALLASFCVTIQTIVFYFLGKHIPMIIESFCTSSVRVQYHNAISTGLVQGMYRPCAFFLEPAHYTECCIMGLLSLLSYERTNIRRSVIISIGIVLTTSGMGIVLTFCLWVWKYFLGASNISIVKRIKNVAGIILVLIVSLLILSRFPFFENAINRMFDSNSSVGALHGRTIYWDTFFKGKKFTDFIWGFGYEELPEVYFTGFMSIIYCYGIVGYVFLLLFVGRVFLSGERFEKMVCILFVGLMFVSNVTNFLYVVFVLGLASSQMRTKQLAV